MPSAVSSSTSGSSTLRPSTVTAGAADRIPPTAFDDHTGITTSTVDVATIATLTDGLFKGAAVGTLAYADYVDASGGVNGRRIDVNIGDDGSTRAGNRLATQAAMANDFALVGGFSLEDASGGTLLRTNPDMPDVAVTLDRGTADLPNVFSPVPLPGGWVTGPFRYLKARFPGDVGATASLMLASPSALSQWAAERYALERTGYRVVYDPTVPVGRTDFTPNVVAMRRAGVRVLVLDQLPAAAAAAVLRAMAAQDFHPVVVLGATDYSDALVAKAGGATAVDGAFLEQTSALYLGQDAAVVPAVQVFDRWVEAAAPGFQPDLYTLYGWLSAELFAQALQRAGSDPSRGSLLRALAETTSFSGDGLVAPADPAAKMPSRCYLLAQVTGGAFTRLATPVPSSTSPGFRCDGRYLSRPA